MLVSRAAPASAPNDHRVAAGEIRTVFACNWNVLDRSPSRRTREPPADSSRFSSTLHAGTSRSRGREKGTIQDSSWQVFGSMTDASSVTSGCAA
jgi:hypothetical protein